MIQLKWSDETEWKTGILDGPLAGFTPDERLKLQACNTEDEQVVVLRQIWEEHRAKYKLKHDAEFRIV